MFELFLASSNIYSTHFRSYVLINSDSLSFTLLIRNEKSDGNMLTFYHKAILNRDFFYPNCLNSFSAFQEDKLSLDQDNCLGRQHFWGCSETHNKVHEVYDVLKLAVKVIFAKFVYFFISALSSQRKIPTRVYIKGIKENRKWGCKCRHDLKVRFLEKLPPNNVIYEHVGT